jgi:thermostable 8-oxoguanine DNA glycosylase
MKLTWEIEPDDVQRVKSFRTSHKSSPFVQQRIDRNCRSGKPKVRKDEFWRQMVACLLTTQQRSGPGSVVTRFINSKPFPLSYRLRRTNKIADELQTNLDRLEDGLWSETMSVLDKLRANQTVASDREAADFIHDNFMGFGPKQSRNLLQSLGLSKYEIPIDSRITKWLNDFGFPVKLSATGLSDRNYYNFVSNGFQQLCKEANVTPCVLDAAIFASFDDDEWSEENMMW